MMEDIILIAPAPVAKAAVYFQYLQAILIISVNINIDANPTIATTIIIVQHIAICFSDLSMGGVVGLGGGVSSDIFKQSLNLDTDLLI